MSDLEHARQLLRLAHKDFAALGGMRDALIFAEEVFGFHAQQATEKALKAWLASLDLEYPLTHNIASLLGALEKTGCDVSNLWGLVDFNPFGVMFRYEEVAAADEPLDREGVIVTVSQLLDTVEEKIGSAG